MVHRRYYAAATLGSVVSSGVDGFLLRSCPACLYSLDLSVDPLVFVQFFLLTAASLPAWPLGISLCCMARLSTCAVYAGIWGPSFFCVSLLP